MLYWICFFFHWWSLYIYIIYILYILYIYIIYYIYNIIYIYYILYILCIHVYYILSWSPWHDVISALFGSHSHIKSSFFQIAEKIEKIATAKGLLNNILHCFWKSILERFNKYQFKFYRSDITLNSSCEFYSSLK